MASAIFVLLPKYPVRLTVTIGNGQLGSGVIDGPDVHHQFNGSWSGIIGKPEALRDHNILVTVMVAKTAPINDAVVSVDLSQDVPEAGNATVNRQTFSFPFPFPAESGTASGFMSLYLI
jgi:hypothetical protein